MEITKKRLKDGHKDIFFAVLICLAAVAANFVYSFDETEKISYKIVLAGIMGVFTGLLILKRMLCKEDNKLLRALAAISVFMLIYSYLLGRYRYGDIKNVYFIPVTGVAFCILSLGLLLIFWKDHEKNSNVVYYVLFLAFLVRFLYFTMAGYDIAQNDVGRFEDNHKHLGYIRYIFYNGTIPRENPMVTDQFCHPPLHHFIAAFFLKLCKAAGFEQEIWVENLQTLPLIYTSMSMLFLDKIARCMKITVNGRTVVLLIAAFFPYNILLSGALNNDALLFLLMLLSIYFTLKWYEQPQWRWIIGMAFAIGLAMMTKLSGALIAPAMAFLMLHKWWKERHIWKKYLLQFVVFGCISFPLGLWYSVLRFVQYKMPFGFVVRLPLDSYQYIGNYKTWERFLDFSNFWSSPVLRGREEYGYIDHNIFTAIIKNALFANVDYHQKSTMTFVVGWIGLVVMILLFVFLIIGYVAFLKNKENNAVLKVFTICAIGTIFISYISFCLDCPHVCTMHIRYIFIAVCILILTLGIQVSKSSSKFTQSIVRILALIYCSTFMLLIFSLLNVMKGTGIL